MKGFGVFERGKVGWMEKADPVCGPRDAIARPIAIDHVPQMCIRLMN